MLNFDRSTVNHSTHNIQNECDQWLSGSFKVTKFVFGRGSAPDHAGDLTALPRPLAGVKGLISKGRRGCRKREREKEKRKGRGREGEGTGGTAPLRKFLDSPLHCITIWGNREILHAGK